MGWGNCGTDSNGRPIGYSHPATCDHHGCEKKIDRGLSYACGGMHGDGNIYNSDCGCEGYFCTAHLKLIVLVDGEVVGICSKCFDEAVKNGYNEENETWAMST